MESFKEFGRSSQRRHERSDRRHRRIPDESTGAEAEYLRSLVDSRAEVTVFLESGERLKGRIRYFDREVFSIQLADRGLNILLQKSSVLSIREH
jgi:sRNA-binding regulator protein Hfq